MSKTGKSFSQTAFKINAEKIPMYKTNSLLSLQTQSRVPLKYYFYCKSHRYANQALCFNLLNLATIPNETVEKLMYILTLLCFLSQNIFTLIMYLQKIAGNFSCQIMGLRHLLEKELCLGSYFWV